MFLPIQPQMVLALGLALADALLSVPTTRRVMADLSLPAFAPIATMTLGGDSENSLARISSVLVP